MKIRLVFIGLAAVLAGAVKGAEGHSGRRPNVVFILSDDHRHDLMSFMGNPYIKTPNLDRLNNLADDPVFGPVFQTLEKTLGEQLAERGDTFCACKDLRHWFDSERRVVANAFGPLPHPETEPDWSLL